MKGGIIVANTNKTIVKRKFISGRINEKSYEFDSKTADSITEIAYWAKLRDEHSNWNWDRKRKTEDELLELLNQGQLSEEELEKIYKERLRKAALSVKRNIEICINSRPFYYFITFTSNKSHIFSNPFFLIKKVNKYLRKQKLDFVIVLEPFTNESKGWHVHGITSAPVDFADWLRENGANTDDGEELGEKYNFVDAYLKQHNLYCEPIITNEEACFRYSVKKIEESYLRLKEMRPDENVKMFYSTVSVPSGSEIESHVGGYEVCNYADPISKFIAEYQFQFVQAWNRNYNENEMNVDLFDFVAQEYLDLYKPNLYNYSDLPGKEKKLLKYVRATLIDLACRFIKKNQDFLYEAYDIIGLCYCNNDEKYEAYRNKYIHKKMYR